MKNVNIRAVAKKNIKITYYQQNISKILKTIKNIIFVKLVTSYAIKRARMIDTYPQRNIKMQFPEVKKH